MMDGDDLVKRLRDFEQWMRDPEDQKFTLSSDLFDEAASRIEELEEKLRKENNYAYVIDSQGIVHHSFTIVYRDTLGEKKDA